MLLYEVVKLNEWARQQRFDDYLRGIRISAQIVVNNYCVQLIRGRLEILPFRWSRNAHLPTRGEWQNRIIEATR